MPGTPPPRALPRLYAILDVDVSAAQGVSPDALLDEWLPIVVALTVSTVLAIAATALTFQWLARRQEGTEPEQRG